jgi:hypothetical protein
MSLDADRSDDSSDYVSMHHRITKGLRRRLKHLSVDLGKPVTDLVNEAILAHLDRLGPAEAPPRHLSAEKLLLRLREARQEGSFYEAISGVDKLKLVEVSRLLGETADMRSSGDRLIARIAAALADPL